MLIQAKGGSVRNVVSAVRKRLDLSLARTRVVHDEDQGDGLHRIELKDGTIVEALIKPRSRCEVTILGA